jgi:hypothetical protein
MNIAQTKPTRYNQPISINRILGSSLQNSWSVNNKIIDREFDEITSLDFDIQPYKDQLQMLKNELL